MGQFLQESAAVFQIRTLLHCSICICEELHDELLRDRLEVGFQDLSLSEKTQMNKNISLTQDHSFYGFRVVMCHSVGRSGLLLSLVNNIEQLIKEALT